MSASPIHSVSTIRLQVRVLVEGCVGPPRGPSMHAPFEWPCLTLSSPATWQSKPLAVLSRAPQHLPLTPTKLGVAVFGVAHTDSPDWICESLRCVRGQQVDVDAWSVCTMAPNEWCGCSEWWRHLPSQSQSKGIKLKLILLHPFLQGDAQSFVILRRQTSPSPSRFFRGAHRNTSKPACTFNRACDDMCMTKINIHKFGKAKRRQRQLF